jgi:hypothetical protein
MERGCRVHAGVVPVVRHRNPRLRARVGTVDGQLEEDSMRGVKVVAIVGALLWAPATAAAAEKPVVTTGSAANVAPTTATLNGRVNPKGASTTYFFQVGPTVLYGSNTPATPVGAGNKGVRVSLPVGGLAPATRYHYRLVAQNRRGITLGERKTFKTKPQPLGVSLGATPNPIREGELTTLSGVLSGTGNSGRQVVLKSNPWPYTQGFLPVGNVMVTNADGSFSSTVASVPVNTQFVVQMPAKPEIVSPIVVVETTVKVTRKVSVRRFERRGRLRFRGTVTPAVDGRDVYIQKLRDGVWENIAKTVTRWDGGSSSSYRKIVRQRKGGRYRAIVWMADKYSPSTSPNVRIKRVRD